MGETLGSRIAEKRRAKNLTQENLAERMGVSAQAVSKWENDASCPDVMSLPKLAEILDTTVDALLSGEKQPDVVYVPEEKRRSADELMIRIRVNSSGGERVRVNVPLSLVRVLVESGSKANIVSGKGMENIDFGEIIRLAERGLLGKIVEVETDDGDFVEVLVE